MEKKESVNLEELDKVSGGFMMEVPSGYICQKYSMWFEAKSEYDEHIEKVHGNKPVIHQP